MIAAVVVAAGNVGRTDADSVAMSVARPEDAFPPVMVGGPAVSQSGSFPVTGILWPATTDNTGAVRWSGPTAMSVNGTVTGPSGTVNMIGATPPYSGAVGSMVVWEFCTDAPKFALLGANHGPAYFEIDGRCIEGLTLANPGVSNWIFTFPTRKVRKVRVLSGSLRLAGVVTTPIDSVFAPPQRPAIGLMGDSYLQTGSVLVAGSRPPGITHILSRLIGADAFVSAVGSTGYITDLSGQPTTSFLDRTPFFDDLGISLMVWMGGINDPITGLQAGAQAVFERFATAHPSTPQVALGPWSPSATWQTDHASHWPAIQAAIESVGGTFIDNRGWVTGTGNIGTPAADGNADVVISSDGIHPSVPADSVNGIGTAFLGSRVATAIRQLLMTGVI